LVESGVRRRRAAHGFGPERRSGVSRVARCDGHVRIVEGPVEERSNPSSIASSPRLFSPNQPIAREPVDGVSRVEGTGVGL
jgi:hypothetical protein